MKFENTRIYGFEAAFRGMRNPLNSWHLSDSEFGIENMCYFDDPRSKVAYAWATSKPEEFADTKMLDYYNAWLLDNGIIHKQGDLAEYAFIGPKDMRLAQKLIAGGTEHRKFLRQIFVSVDITAPIYW